MGIVAANAATLRPLIRSWIQASSSFRSTAAWSVARRPSTRARRRHGDQKTNSLAVAVQAAGQDTEALKAKISNPRPLPRASIGSTRACRWAGGRWGKSVATEDIEALPSLEIRKTTDMVMVGEEHELSCVNSPYSMDKERWRRSSVDSEGSEVKMNPQPPPPLPLKSPRDRGKGHVVNQETTGASSRMAAFREHHCRCNCRALDFEQVRALLEGTWIGNMAAGPSGTRHKGPGKE